MPFDFNKECLGAFLRLKEVVIMTPMTQAPYQGLPFEVMCDVSDFALGVVLGQRKDRKPYAIHYVSQNIDEAQVNYVTTEKEFLAVVFALEKFQS